MCLDATVIFFKWVQYPAITIKIMKNSKTFEFKTIEEIINTIHLGNKDNFLVDFKAWLEVTLNAAHMVRLSIELSATPEQKEQYKDKKNSELLGCNSLKWVDDGKHNISIKVTTK